jgi:hypothetical protein
MKKMNYSIGENPTVNITVKKSRLKNYYVNNKKTYYLNDGTEFEIELFNPTNQNILAEIKLNDKIISNAGLVLKPGQRIYLERYLDSQQKFLFETYDVENTNEALSAIENNGDLSVSFYKEREYFKTPYFYPDYNYITLTTNSNNNYLTSNTSYDNLSGIIYCSVNNTNNYVETGRIEKGSYSNQKFTNVDIEFSDYYFYRYNCKLLPLSQKITTDSDLKVRNYCKNCGHKLGKTDNYCGQCGTKI